MMTVQRRAEEGIGAVSTLLEVLKKLEWGVMLPDVAREFSGSREWNERGGWFMDI